MSDLSSPIDFANYNERPSYKASADDAPTTARDKFGGQKGD